MTNAHYYVLMHKKKGLVLGFYSSIEEAESAKQIFSSPNSNEYVPLSEMEIIETDSTLQKI
jgi:hypothetical protein